MGETEGTEVRGLGDRGGELADAGAGHRAAAGRVRCGHLHGKLLCPPAGLPRRPERSQGNNIH